MYELERRLRETLEGRADNLGRPRPLPPESTRRISRRRRLTTGVAVALVVLVAATTAFALRRPDADQQLAAGSGPAACYPAGLPRELADEVRRVANGAGPDNGVPPSATFSRMPPTTTPDATWPTVENGYLIELTGLDLSHIETSVKGSTLPPGKPAETTPPSERAEFVYDADAHLVGWGSSDQLGAPGQLGPLSEATPISLDASCGAVTPATADPLSGRTVATFEGAPPDASQLQAFGDAFRGLTLDQASWLAGPAGWMVRAVKVDGVALIASPNRFANRLDVAITNGVIAGPVTAG